MIGPHLVIILPFNDNHTGNPIIISKSITPTDHISASNGFIDLNGLGPGSNAHYLSCSRCFNISGARYSGVFIENEGIWSYSQK